MTSPLIIFLPWFLLVPHQLPWSLMMTSYVPWSKSEGLALSLLNHIWGWLYHNLQTDVYTCIIQYKYMFMYRSNMFGCPLWNGWTDCNIHVTCACYMTPPTFCGYSHQISKCSQWPPSFLSHDFPSFSLELFPKFHHPTLRSSHPPRARRTPRHG